LLSHFLFLLGLLLIHASTINMGVD
jgi:hypothetical protein